MARLSFGYNYNPGAISGGGEGTALHTDFGASAPFVGAGGNQYTLGSIYSFGSGNTERTYFTLQHNTSSAEILVGWPDGVDASYTNMAHSTKRDSAFDGFQQLLWVSYSPGGGFETSLAAANDPANSGFWPTDSSIAIPVPYAYEGNTVDLWFLADDARAELTVVVRKTTNIWAFVVLGDELVDNTYDSTTVPQQYGYCYGWTDTAAPAPDILVQFKFGYFNGTNFTAISNNYPQNMEILEGAVDANQPSANTKYVTAALPILDSAGIYGWWNTEHIRLAGRTNSDTYKLKRGTDTDHILIHLVSDVYIPWDDNLAVPT